MEQSSSPPCEAMCDAEVAPPGSNQACGLEEKVGAVEGFGSPFEETPLDHSQNKIRVWKFTTSASVYCISIDLVLLDTDGDQKYTALSYVWGEPKSLRVIFVNDAPLKVTPSLYGFLSTLLLNGEYTDRFFWADQISIDQTNTTERNHQVGLMSKVFSGAEGVFASLGDSPSFGVHLPYLYAESFSHAEIITMADLFSRPYFSRLWIVQEILLAKIVLFWLGGYQISQKHMNQLCRKFETKKEVFSGDSWDRGRQWASEQGMISANDDFEDRLMKFSRTLDNNFGYIMPVHDLVKGAKVRSETNLGGVLARYGDKQCQDLRDKIFGLQALVHPSQRISIDYGMSMSKLRRLFFKCHFGRDMIEVYEAQANPQRQAWLDHFRQSHQSSQTYHGIKDLQGYKVLSVTDESRELGYDDWSIWSRAMSWAFAVAFDQHWNADAWCEQWHRLSIHATTPRQQELGKQLNKTGCDYYLRMEGNFAVRHALHRKPTRDLNRQCQCAFCKQLAAQARRIIDETAAAHGFITVDGFLLHPEELCPEWSIRMECLQTSEPPAYAEMNLLEERSTDSDTRVSEQMRPWYTVCGGHLTMLLSTASMPRLKGTTKWIPRLKSTAKNAAKLGIPPK